MEGNTERERSNPSWMPPPILEDDSWLDEEIEQEVDPRMKNKLIEVKRTMPTISNERKIKYIFEERKRVVEWKQYANDINTTHGFEVGTYPYLSRKASCGMITRYYCPPDATITDYELANLTRLANLAIDYYNSRQGTHYHNAKVIKAMRSFAFGPLYYLTFQVSLLGSATQIFEARLYDKPNASVEIQLVRPKMHQPN